MQRTARGKLRRQHVNPCGDRADARPSDERCYLFGLAGAGFGTPLPVVGAAGFPTPAGPVYPPLTPVLGAVRGAGRGWYPSVIICGRGL